MKYFLDTEFIEDGKTIDLVSIGIVAEDGREYYAINSECDFSKANDWVKEHVLVHLPPRNSRPPDGSTHWMRQWKTRRQIRDEVAEFCGCLTDYEYAYKRHPWLGFLGISQSQLKSKFFVPDGSSLTPEFWGYYADYDWVVFCQLFGTMMDLPKGFPMYCRDLKQLADSKGNPRLPQQESTEHNALYDARWNKQAYEFLESRAAVV